MLFSIAPLLKLYLHIYLLIYKILPIFPSFFFLLFLPFLFSFSSSFNLFTSFFFSSTALCFSSHERTKSSFSALVLFSNSNLAYSLASSTFFWLRASSSSLVFFSNSSFSSSSWHNYSPVDKTTAFRFFLAKPLSSSDWCSTLTAWTTAFCWVSMSFMVKALMPSCQLDFLRPTSSCLPGREWAGSTGTTRSGATEKMPQ